MFNPQILGATYNEGMKGNAKCKNSHFEPPFGGLGVTHIVHLWLDGKCVVDFLLVLIVLLDLMAQALLSEICQNRRFLKGWVTLSARFTQIVYLQVKLRSMHDCFEICIVYKWHYINTLLFL